MLLKNPTVSIYACPKDEIFIGDFRKVTDVQSLIMYQNSKLLKVIITFRIFTRNTTMVIY